MGSWSERGPEPEVAVLACACKQRVRGLKITEGQSLDQCLNACLMRSLEQSEHA